MESQLYETHTLRKKQSASELPRSNVSLHDILGLDINRRCNLSFIETDRIVYAAGNCVVFQNILTKQKEYLFGLDENGIGCVAVHPTRNYIAVGACGFNPNIYILKVYSTFALTYILYCIYCTMCCMLYSACNCYNVF